MQQFTLPIFLAGITAIFVLLSGLIGGVNFLLILKRIFLFGLIIGGLGFLIQFLLQKWGIDLSSTSDEGQSQQNLLNQQENPMTESEDSGDVDENNQESQVNLNESQKTEKTVSDSNFDYTVKDDDEIEFKPLDETLLEKNKTKYIDYQGEKIEYDPKKAAMTIRQLLEEDKSHGE